MATRELSASVVEVLLSRHDDVDINAKDKYGNTPMLILLKFGITAQQSESQRKLGLEIAKMFLTHPGVDVNV